MPTRTFTEEERRALAGLLPFDPNAYVEFTPPEFKKVAKEFWPIFYISAFSNLDINGIRAAVKAGNFDETVMRSAISGQALRHGWKNLRRLPDGHEIPYSPEIYKDLPDSLVVSIYMEAARLSGLTKEEKEGLESSPPPTSEPSSNPAPDAEGARA